MGKFKDLTGQRFGRLVVQESYESKTKPSGQKYTNWKCKCDCGNECWVSVSNLRRGHTTSCGCYLEEYRHTISHPKTVGPRKVRTDLAGKKFGHVTVKHRVENKITSAGASLIQWECECDCGNTCYFTSNSLKQSSNSISCGCARPMPPHENITGDISNQRFGRLLVIDKSHDWKQSYKWHCICDCGNECNIIGSNLVRGLTKSCGCLNKEAARQRQLDKKSLNRYDLTSKSYGIGYCNRTDKEIPFYFDLEDYDKIKNYEWTYEAKEGNIITYDATENNCPTYLHHIIIEKPVDKYVTHIHGKESRYDNRKANLRICDQPQYEWNIPLRSNNTSGVTGVHYNKSTDRWVASITHNKIIERKWFKNKEDAIKQRKEWEEEFFGEYSYDNSQAVKLD